jgi:hypothetical protein
MFLREPVHQDEPGMYVAHRCVCVFVCIWTGQAGLSSSHDLGDSRLRTHLFDADLNFYRAFECKYWLALRVSLGWDFSRVGANILVVGMERVSITVTLYIPVLEVLCFESWQGHRISWPRFSRFISFPAAKCRTALFECLPIHHSQVIIWPSAIQPRCCQRGGMKHRNTGTRVHFTILHHLSLLHYGKLCRIIQTCNQPHRAQVFSTNW